MPFRDFTSLGAIRAGAALLALACYCAGLFLSASHPILPRSALLPLYSAWTLAVWFRPRLWLFWMPVLLPILNFSPWTGWLLFEEFDLLLLGIAAGGYAALAQNAYRPPDGEEGRQSRLLCGLLLTFAASGLLALVRGFSDGGSMEFGWFQGYGDAMNSLRSFKSFFFAGLLLALWRQEWLSRQSRCQDLLAAGLAVGLGLVSLAVLWERAAFPGILDFSTPYRPIALFWEMHTGGGALDGYLALTLPFGAWALLRASRPGQWMLGALIGLLALYACLTSFSRGLYLALGSLLVLGGVLAADRLGRSDGNEPRPWQVLAGVAAIAVMVIQTALVLAGGTFMRDRLEAGGDDFASRLRHWEDGLKTLDSPSAWLLGRGLGRFPASYSARMPRDRVAAPYRFALEGGNPHVELFGPPSRGDGVFRLSQRVGIPPGDPPILRLDIRVAESANLRFRLCEMHLLYEGGCLRGQVLAKAAGEGWQHLEIPLAGDVLSGGPGYAPRLGFFSIDITGRGQRADIDNVSLRSPEEEELLANGDFSQGLARWFPLLRDDFLPWHIDNLFLELLLGQGIVGLASFAAAVLAVLWRLLGGIGPTHTVSTYLAASLSAFLVVGCFSSLMDVPRLAFLFLFLLGVACLLGLRCRAGAREIPGHAGNSFICCR